MLERLAAGDFYILCPDNETTRPRTRSGSPGRPATSSRTGPPCRAGIRTMRRRSSG